MSETFDAAEHDDERMIGVLDDPLQRRDLALEQKACGRLVDVFRHASGRRVRAMRRAERVVDVDIRERAQCSAELGVVLRLARFVARVLEQDDLALLKRIDELGDGGADQTGREFHVLAEQFAEASRRPGFSESFGSPSLGRPRCEVTITFAPLFTRYSIVGTDAAMRASSDTTISSVLLFQRGVEIGADEHALSAYIKVADGLLAE